MKVNYGEVRTSSTGNLDMVIKGHMLKNLTFFKNIFKNQHLKFMAQSQNLNQSISSADAPFMQVQ